MFNLPLVEDRLALRVVGSYKNFTGFINREIGVWAPNPNADPTFPPYPVSATTPSTVTKGSIQRSVLVCEAPCKSWSTICLRLHRPYGFNTSTTGPHLTTTLLMGLAQRCQNSGMQVPVGRKHRGRLKGDFATREIREAPPRLGHDGDQGGYIENIDIGLDDRVNFARR